MGIGCHLSQHGVWKIEHLPQRVDKSAKKGHLGIGHGTRYPVGQAERQLEAGPEGECPGLEKMPVEALAAGGGPPS